MLRGGLIFHFYPSKIDVAFKIIIELKSNSDPFLIQRNIRKHV